MVLWLNLGSFHEFSSFTCARCRVAVRFYTQFCLEETQVRRILLFVLQSSHCSWASPHSVFTCALQTVQICEPKNVPLASVDFCCCFVSFFLELDRFKPDQTVSRLWGVCVCVSVCVQEIHNTFRTSDLENNWFWALLVGQSALTKTSSWPRTGASELWKFTPVSVPLVVPLTWLAPFTPYIVPWAPPQRPLAQPLL